MGKLSEPGIRGLRSSAEGGRGGLRVSPVQLLPPPLLLSSREGHVSLVRELKAALGTPPGALVLAVGGGGLLAGVSAGLEEVGWQHVPIVAMETRGAHCFNAALEAGRLVTLPDITRWARAGDGGGLEGEDAAAPGLLAPSGGGGAPSGGSPSLGLQPRCVGLRQRQR